MSIMQFVIISLLQGVTEWLPISSSGHVLLASSYFGFGTRDELLINAMAHVGTLFAVLLYFWKDVGRTIGGGFELVGAPFRKAGLSANARLAVLILVSMPIALAIALLHEIVLTDEMKSALRSVWTVAGSTFVFGLLLWWADVKGENRKDVSHMSIRDAVLIGASQAIAAVIPGTSRSGITMTAARWMGFERTEAARFSMLIGAPILAAGGVYAVLEFLTADAGEGVATLADGMVVAGLSFLSGIVSIWALMAILKRMSFLPFVIYRILLAVLLILFSPLVLGIIPG